MDEHLFDDTIKKKVGEYDAPAFDPSALAALHHQMAAGKLVWPWYSRYRTDLMIGSMIILSTVVILSSHWFMTTESQEKLESQIRHLEAQVQHANASKTENNPLSFQSPDTIWNSEMLDRNSLPYRSLIMRIAELEKVVEELGARLNLQDEADGPEIPFSNPDFDNKYPATPNHRSSSLNHRVIPRQKEKESRRAQFTKDRLSATESEVKLSAATIRQIEKHYSKGIGMKLGPLVEFSYGRYQTGSGNIDPAAGIAADFIFSSWLSLETGLKYIHRFYSITNSNDLNENALPYRDNSLGSLNRADIDSWIFEMPVNLKYRRPISLKSDWYIGAGYSSLLYTMQDVEYEYDFDNASAASINASHRQNSWSSHPGLLNLSLGTSRQLKNHKLFETSVYYQLGLGARGVEKIKGGFLGARGVYWFTIR